MTDNETISLIEKARKIEDVLAIESIDTEYKQIIKLIHPDRCKISGAADATMKLNELRDVFEKGKEFRDDAGLFRTNGYFFKHSGQKTLLETSLTNYKKLMALKGNAADVFHKFLPKSMTFQGDVLCAELARRAIPLSKIDALEEKHGLWILNRLLEFSAWLAENDIVHCGFNPESVFITPEDHGLQIVSFYHMTREGSKINTISAKYQSWYSPSVFTDKTAKNIIDVELAKRTVVSAMGDSSGAGIIFRKTHNPTFVNFLSTHHDGASFAIMDEYKKMIKATFESKFHVLDI